MTAAGFVLETNGEDPVLQHGTCDPVPLRLRYICVHVRVRNEKIALNKKVVLCVTNPS